MANSVDVVSDEKRRATCTHLQRCFERSYDLSKHGDQMTLVEALTEIGKATALTGSSAVLSLTFGADGVTGLAVNSVLKPAAAENKE
jgi:hypothetical protein